MPTRLLPAVLLALCTFLGAAGARAADTDPFQGAWLFESASMRGQPMVSRVWDSTLTVKGGTFTLSKLMGVSKNLTGKFTLGGDADAKTIDLKVEELDLSEVGAPVKLPAATLRGIYKFDAGRLTICCATETAGKRPTSFAPADGVLLMTLSKAPAGFKGFPKEVTFKALDPDGKPAAGVRIATFLSPRRQPNTKNTKREWDYYRAVKTAADGTAKVKYEDLGAAAIVARDEDNKQMAIVPLSPAALAGGATTLKLKPECRVSGTIVCPELKKLGKPLGWANVYAMIDGRRVAMCDSPKGEFEFVLPPGKYDLHAYGSDLQTKTVPLTVPAKKNTLTADPIALTAAKLVLLQGRQAPELEGIIGWKGKKVKLSDLKGKIVLLEFWGYWCGPCVGIMPMLIDLHEKFADKGLVIVGIHVDAGDGVDTQAKLDAKIAGFRKKLWKGKDIPFPVALTSGQRIGGKIGGPAAQYGVQAYPTTVLIDKEGKVVGKFGARDAKSAAAKMEKLLGGK